MLLEPPVRNKIELLLKEYKSTNAAVRTVELHEINNKGNFGKLTYYERRASYARQDSGLWAVLSSGTFTSGAGGGTMQSLSLCGLVTLVSTMSATTYNDLTAAIPIGKIFVPFGMRSSIDQSRRQRVTNLETDANVCAPAPSTDFSYRTETEVLSSTSGLLRLSNSTKRDEHFACKVNAESIPASKIFPSLRGDSLRVTCERTAGWGGKITREYAFLKDAALYVLLSETGEVQVTQVQFKDAEQVQ